MIRARVHAITLTGAIALLGASCTTRDAMTFEKIEYLIGDDPDAPDILLVEADGKARFHLHSNEFAPDEPVIGEFETVLPPERMTALRQALATPPFEGLPDHWKRIRPGERNRRIRMHRDGETIEKFLCFREPIDPSTQRLLDTLDALARDMKSHPRQTLSIDVARVDVSTNGEITVLLTFANNGTEPLGFRTPIGMAGDDMSQVQFQLWRDKPQSELKPDDLATLAPGLVEDLNEGRAGTPTYAELRAGDSAMFGARLQMPAGMSGQYILRAAYAYGYAESDGRPVISGELFSRPVPVTIP